MPTLPPRTPPFFWKPLVVCPQAGMGQRILAVLHELSMEAAVPITEYPRIGQIAAIAQQGGCDICFLDVASNSEHAQLLIAELAPAIPVVALHTRADADLILRCLRRGACEFLTDPAADVVDSLFSRLERARHPGAARAAGSIYAVVPGKAGSGASTIAAHLAIRFGSGGARVLLVDGDTVCASISFLLKLKSEFHLGDVLRDWRRMDDDLWKRLPLAACGVDVLAAPADPSTRIEIDPQAAAQLAAFWRERYDVVVLDLAGPRAAAETGFAGIANYVLLVTANELGALQATRRAAEFLEEPMSGRSRLRLILNRYNPATGLKREDIERALGLEPYAILVDDWATMQAALLDGRPVPNSSRFAASVETLCRLLRPQQAGADDDAARRHGWQILRRRHRVESGK